MMALTIMAMLFGTFFLVYWWNESLTKYPKNFPPGPRHWLPILGDALALGVKPASSLTSIHREYGKIVGLNVLGHKVVSVGSIKLLKEILNHENMAKRPHFETVSLLRGAKMGESCPGIALSNGRVWSETSRFTLNKLKAFGFGKHAAEDMIQIQLEDLIKGLKALEGQRASHSQLSLLLNTHIVSFLWKMISGPKAIQDKDHLTKILQVSGETIRNLVTPFAILSAVFPWIDSVARKVGKNCLGLLDTKNLKMLDTIISQHESTYCGEEMRDFIDYFLKEYILRYAFIVKKSICS